MLEVIEEDTGLVTEVNSQLNRTLLEFLILEMRKIRKHLAEMSDVDDDELDSEVT